MIIHTCHASTRTVEAGGSVFNASLYSLGYRKPYLKKANYFRKGGCDACESCIQTCLVPSIAFQIKGAPAPKAAKCPENRCELPLALPCLSGSRRVGHWVAGPASAWHPLPHQKVMLGLPTLVTRGLSPLLSMGPTACQVETLLYSLLCCKFPRTFARYKPTI